jgi:hypothetical protein
MAYPWCPECGAPLSVSAEVDEVTGNIVVKLFCEGPAEDVYVLKIDTHLCNDELLDWDVVGSKHEATVELVEREPDPDYKLDIETMELVERKEGI